MQGLIPPLGIHKAVIAIVLRRSVPHEFGSGAIRMPSCTFNGVNQHDLFLVYHQSFCIKVCTSSSQFHRRFLWYTVISVGNGSSLPCVENVRNIGDVSVRLFSFFHFLLPMGLYYSYNSHSTRQVLSIPPVPLMASVVLRFVPTSPRQLKSYEKVKKGTVVVLPTIIV